MMRPIFLSLLVALFLTSSAEATWCPTGEYDEACLKSAIPPWPICLFKSAEQFVESAKDGATRCCKENGDLSDCKCPKKDTEKFKAGIEEWCKGVATCKEE